MDDGGFGSEPTGVVGLGSGLLGRTLRFMMSTENVALQLGNLLFKMDILLLQGLQLFSETLTVRAPSQVWIGHENKHHLLQKKSNGNDGSPASDRGG